MSYISPITVRWEDKCVDLGFDREDLLREFEFDGRRWMVWGLSKPPQRGWVLPVLVLRDDGEMYRFGLGSLRKILHPE